jgi:uncharacterized RDD family membrane protein YckC
MTITFPCDACGQRYQVDESLAGKRIKCKKCESVLTIPPPVAAPAKTARPLQTFGGASTKPTPRMVPPPLSPPRPRADMYDLDEAEGPAANPYSLDEAYIPPRVALAPEEPAPPRPGRPARGKSRRLEYAGFGRRWLAAIIDNIILLAVGFAIGMGVGYGMIASGIDPSTPGPQLALTVLGIVINLLYNGLMISSTTQATLGKMAMGIKVTDLDGRPISFGRALGRELGKILSTCTLLIGYLMAAFTERKQALHDMLAGTLVVQA